MSVTSWGKERARVRAMGNDGGDFRRKLEGEFRDWRGVGSLVGCRGTGWRITAGRQREGSSGEERSSAG